jgi:sialic acid synthase SpsE
MSFKINNLKIDKNNVIVIAEAGVNHNGRMDYAESLIKEAKKAGAQIIKFQTYKAEKLVSKTAERFWEWSGEVKKKGSQFDSYARLDKFGYKEYKQLKKLCDKYKIEFMSTPFDIDSVDMLCELGVSAFKIASCDITNYLLIEYIAKKNLPIFLSTGASNMQEILNAVNLIKKNGNTKICIMHCTLCYPTKFEDANLEAIIDIKKKFPNYILGLSDHTLGTLVAPASILYGVTVIEKHFTINKKLKKSADHWLSVNPSELKTLVENSKNILLTKGIGKKTKLKCENKTYQLARRSIYALKNIKSGEKLTKKNVTCKRPGIYVPASKIYEFLGKKVNRDIEEDTPILLKFLF